MTMCLASCHLWWHVIDMFLVSRESPKNHLSVICPAKFKFDSQADLIMLVGLRRVTFVSG